MNTWNDEIWRKVDAVFGWLSDGEARELFELAKKAPAGSSVVELGAFMGRSTVALAHGVRAAGAPFSISVDIWTGTQNSSDSGIHASMMEDRGVTDLYGLHRKNMEAAGVAPWVRRIRGRSSVEGIEWATEWKISVGLLFIDACHDYEAVKADFDTWSPLVVSGGAIAFHDNFAPGPARVIAEVSAPFTRLPDVGSLSIFVRS